MLITKQKPLEQILGYIGNENSIFVVGCKGCAEGCQTGGEKEVAEMKQKLEQAGKKVSGTALIDFMCNDSQVRLMLQPHEAEILASDSLLALCCGVGVQATSSVVDKMVHPGCNTVSLGGRHAEWREAERCMECGDCVLEYTGGICPVARCSKFLMNGPCGGSVNGKCEVSKDIPCAWQLIIDRLTKLGRLDKMQTIVAPKDWSVSLTAGAASKR
jgi:ferredoxin